MKIINLILAIYLFSTCCFFELRADREMEFDFVLGNNGWTGDFSDYPADNSESFYDLAWGWANLPIEISGTEKILTKGMYLSGNNHSDDLFMFIRRPVTGLQPNAEYELHFVVTITHNIAPNQSGIGGSPGNSVYFKVGAAAIKPKKVNKEGSYLLNVDKGNQSNGGENALSVGPLENPAVNVDDPQFEPKVFTHEEPLKVKTDDKGRLWLFVGTDSGFEGVTKYYVAKIFVSIHQL